MESFIYNNPEILGQLLDEDGNLISSAVIQQVFTQKREERIGRIDLMALVSQLDGKPLLKIIELKVFAKEEDLNQLKDYLISLNEKNKYKANFIEFIKEESKIEDDDTILDCYNSPIGVFIVSDFEPDLITKINEWNKKSNNNSSIDLYKLLQFKTMESTYIVLDKIIEEPPSTKRKRALFNWIDFARFFNEINIGDIFFIDKKFTSGDNIEFKITDEKRLVTFTFDTIDLMRKRNYLTKSQLFGSKPENFTFKNAESLVEEYFSKIIWEYPPFQRIFSTDLEINNVLNEKVTITNLVQLVLFANEISQSGWVWSKKIIHKKSNKNYRYFRDLLKSSI